MLTFDPCKFEISFSSRRALGYVIFVPKSLQIEIAVCGNGKIEN